MPLGSDIQQSLYLKNPKLLCAWGSRYNPHNERHLKCILSFCRYVILMKGWHSVQCVLCTILSSIIVSRNENCYCYDSLKGNRDSYSNILTMFFFRFIKYGWYAGWLIIHIIRWMPQLNTVFSMNSYLCSECFYNRTVRSMNKFWE